MNVARVLVHAIAFAAGGAAAFLVGSKDEKNPASAPAPAPASIVQLPAADMLRAERDTGMDAATSRRDLRRQAWPAATISYDARKIDISAVRFGASSNR